MKRKRWREWKNEEDKMEGNWEGRRRAREKEKKNKMMMKRKRKKKDKTAEEQI